MLQIVRAIMSKHFCKFEGMKSLDVFKKQLTLHKKRLAKKYSIASIAIFGSYARGDFNKASDLDIMVDFNGDVGIEFVDLAEELENLLQIPVDLVSKNGIKPKYLQLITAELIYV